MCMKTLLVSVGILVLVGIGAVIYRGGDQLGPSSTLSICEYLLEEKAKLTHVPNTLLPEEVYGGKIAALTLDDNFPQAREFRTVLSEALLGGVNFAGHYTVATWGCGTSCQNHAVLDARTGRIIAFGLTSELGAYHEPKSRVLTLNPPQNFPKPGESSMSFIEEMLTWSRIPREYYLLREGEGAAHLEKICVENPYDESFR